MGISNESAGFALWDHGTWMVTQDGLNRQQACLGRKRSHPGVIATDSDV
jgi:hypothetical protein